MNAIAFDGNVYLEDHFTKEARKKRLPIALVTPIAKDRAESFAHPFRLEEEQSYKQQSYFGYSYEAYATTSDKTATVEKSKKKREMSVAVNTNVQWCCVVKSKIGNVRLYMGGEVDCVEGEYLIRCHHSRPNGTSF